MVLVGPNGAGKSSLSALLAGELYPGIGKVLLNGHPFASFTAQQLAVERAALEQNPSVTAPFSVVELVELGTASVPRASID